MVQGKMSELLEAARADLILESLLIPSQQFMRSKPKPNQVSEKNNFGDLQDERQITQRSHQSS
jgi:hypothetical protein